MVKNMLTIFVLGIILSAVSDGFLFHNSSAPSWDGNLTKEDKYYVQIISELRVMVLLLQSEYKNVQYELSKMQQSYGNITVEEFNNIRSMALNFSNLQNELSTCKNQTTILQDNLDLLTEYTKSNMTLLNKKIDLTTSQVHQINTTSFAFLDTMEHLQNKTFHAESDISKLQRQTQRLETENKQMASGLLHLSAFQNSTTQQINMILHNQSRINQEVMLRACIDGTPSLYYNIVRFTHVRTSSGINDINGLRMTGKFTCETPGLYLYSVHILSGSEDMFSIHFNDVVLSDVKFTLYQHGSHYFGKDFMIMNLQQGDTLYISYEFATHIVPSTDNCITVIKLA